MAQLIKGKQIKSQTITINGTSGNVIVTGDLPMGTNKITTTASSFGTNELVTKAYVDSVAQGLDPKESVVTATTVGQNINLASPGNSIGGYSLTVAGTRVLIKNQTDAKQNGIYNWNGAAVAMTRATDSDGSPASEVTLGNFTFVENGTNATTGWVLSSSDATGSIVTPGTNTQVWVQFSGAGSYSADGQGIELSAGQFSIELDGTTLTKSTSGLKLNNSLSTDIADTKTGLSNELVTRSTGLSTELSQRVSTDTVLTNRISTEEVTRSTADTSLTNRISTEEVTRSTGLSTEINVRSTGLSTELSQRVSTDTVLTNRISTEEVTRSTADASLTSRISAEEVTRSTGLSTEINIRSTAVTSLTNRISTEEVTRSTGLSTEINIRSIGLSTELSQRVSTDTVLTNRISTEEVTRSTADASLTSRISAEEVTRSTGLSTELSQRVSTDTVLTNRISTEEVTRSTGLSTEINIRSTGLSTELSQRVSTDTVLTNRISTEEVTRSTGLSTEINIRSTAVASLTNVVNYYVEKNLFDTYSIPVTVTGQTTFTNAITINNNVVFNRMSVDPESVQVHLNGLVYSFSIDASGGGIFYGDGSVWESNLNSLVTYDLYFNQTAAGFALELDDTIIISYRTFGIYGGLS